MIFFENLNHPLAKAVADACAAQGKDVVDVDACGGFENALAANGTPSGFVVCPPAHCEAQGIRGAMEDAAQGVAFGAQTHASAMQFLSDCRAATQTMMTAKTGQVLFLGIDDVAARIVGLPETPIGNQLRVSALKSLAKEYGRMGVKFNAVLSQPSKETVAPAVWKEQRNALKVYTMRFAPTETAEYAAFCATVLAGQVPVNGGLICLGKGVMEMAA